MRITDCERDTLVTSIRRWDPDAGVWLFGSRLDDLKKGGDIDIAILSRRIRVAERMRIRRAIVDRVGERKIDLIVSPDGADPFFRMALETGIRLDE
jgi:predicted nucleotidyltransferase